MLRRKRNTVVNSPTTHVKESLKDEKANVPLGSKRKSKKAEEEHLEKLVLGGDSDVLQSLEEVSKKASFFYCNIQFLEQNFVLMVYLYEKKCTKLTIWSEGIKF